MLKTKQDLQAVDAKIVLGHDFCAQSVAKDYAANHIRGVHEGRKEAFFFRTTC